MLSGVLICVLHLCQGQCAGAKEQTPSAADQHQLVHFTPHLYGAEVMQEAHQCLLQFNHVCVRVCLFVTGVGDIEASPKEDAYSLCAHVPFIAFTKTAHVHVIKCFRALLPLLLKTRTSQCHALASHRWPAQTAVPCIAKARKYTAQ